MEDSPILMLANPDGRMDGSCRFCHKAAGRDRRYL
jgi:hypothetical protein